MLYPNAAKALERIDEFTVQTDRLLDGALTDSDVAFWDHVTLMRADYVRQAFLVDTADRNRWSSLRNMPVSAIRELVKTTIEEGA